MRLSQRDCGTLIEALGALDRGLPDAFDDALWIGFGDRWWSVRTQLNTQGFIRLRGPGDGTPEPTDRGQRLARRLARDSKAALTGSTQG